MLPPAEPLEASMERVAQSPRPTDLACEQTEAAEHEQQAGAGDEGQAENPTARDEDDPGAEADEAIGGMNHGTAGALERRARFGTRAAPGQRIGLRS
jgi:hypothetical protein